MAIKSGVCSCYCCYNWKIYLYLRLGLSSQLSAAIFAAIFYKNTTNVCVFLTKLKLSEKAQYFLLRYRT
jgi:hypothetical protein